ncbi:MAG: DUF3160 domain-containing protein [Planctomycetota bacterium]
MKKLVVTLTMILAGFPPCGVSTTTLIASPIPIPTPASMPLEDIHVEIKPSAGGLAAVVTGEFTFAYIPEDVNSMMLPVPPDANNIRLSADDVELPWVWSSEEYPTALPEMPGIPMIEWQGPFPTDGVVFRVDYDHNLIRRPQEFVFLYALGTGKYFPTYEKMATAYFDIVLAPGFEVAGVWLDDVPHEYQVIGSHLMVTVQSNFGPITNDLIVSLVPGYFDGCGVLVQGVECVLFQADAGGLYVLDNPGHFEVGERLWVRGVLDPYCFTICMQGNGCIECDSIWPYSRCDLDADGDVDTADFAILISHWLDTGCSEPDWCDGADLSRDGVVDTNDLGQFVGGCLKCEEGEADEAEKPALGKYYVPYENLVEPNAPGYTLPLDLIEIENYAAMDSMFDLNSVAPLLEQSGFAIIEHDFHVPDSNGDDIVKPFEYLDRMDVPLFVTADTLLHLYHIQFDETLKDVEEREFYGDIRGLTAALLDDALVAYEQYTGDLQEAAKRNIAYLAVAQKLIDPNTQIPALVTKLVTNELAKIDAHAGFAPSDIFIYQEDYSQYVPRGHYTRSQELRRYFRTLIWYGRMAFLLKGAEIWGPMGEALISVEDAKIQTMQAVLLARSIEEVQVGKRSGRQIWDRLYAVTSFYVGLADDLTPYEYLGAVDKVFGSGFVPADLEDPDNLFALKVELALLRSPEIFGGTGNVFVTPPVTPESLDEVLDKTKGMRFMGQRFIPDSYMFQHLVFPEVLGYTGTGDPVPFTLGDTGLGPGRCYPRGLDVMAILGSTQAKTILVEQGDTDYTNYDLRFNELKAEFDAFDLADWNRNLYWSWLYSLRALTDEFPDGYPNFMRTKGWEKKELNAALASWTELRHDTILYAKQSYTPVETAIPHVTGYVEPVPEFYGRLLALTRMTREGLSDFDALSAQAIQRLVNLEDILSRLIEIANKELTNQQLSDEDYWYIKGFAETLEGAIIGVEEKGIKTTLVADVHTHSAEEKVVEEGVGYVDLIIIACPRPDGSIFLAAGPVLSYYEFKHPMSDRLTDEAWRELLDSPNRPNRPSWYAPLILQSEKPSYPAGWTRLTNNDVDDFSPRWSPDGQKIAFESNHDIYVMNSDGSEQTRLTINPGYDISPCWSSDGQKIAFATYRDGEHDIYVMNADGSEQKNLTNNPAIDGGPCWSPDGQKIAFHRGGGPAPPPGRGNSDIGNSDISDIYVMNADGSEQKNLTNNPAFCGGPCWSPDGQKIAFHLSLDGRNLEIYLMNADGSVQKRLTNNFSGDFLPCWSPDGQKIAFESYRDGNFEIYVMNADGNEQSNLTNNPASDVNPCWSPDGKKVAFSSYIYGNLEIFIMNVTQ